jgi:hypothetical protein
MTISWPVTLNRLVLEQSANEIVEEVRSATREFEKAAENVQIRAGSLLAQRVRNCVVVLRQKIRKDIGKFSPEDGKAFGLKAEPMTGRHFNDGLRLDCLRERYCLDMASGWEQCCDKTVPGRAPRTASSP